MQCLTHINLIHNTSPSNRVFFKPILPILWNKQFPHTFEAAAESVNSAYNNPRITSSCSCALLQTWFVQFEIHVCNIADTKFTKCKWCHDCKHDALLLHTMLSTGSKNYSSSKQRTCCGMFWTMIFASNKIWSLQTHVINRKTSNTS